MAIKMHVSDVLDEIISDLADIKSGKVAASVEDIAEIYCVLTGRTVNDYAVQRDPAIDDDNTITFFD